MRRAHYYSVALCILIIAIVALSSVHMSRAARYGWEDIMLKIDPSGIRAFEYGEDHFDAQKPRGYDIERAQSLFMHAASLDTTIPYLYHELARIAFLRGDFKTALSLIDLQISMHGDTTPNSYYIRGLIEGFAGDYPSSADDYQHYLEFDPGNWAAINDYAWVLLKAGRAQTALRATEQGLSYFPGNPWLLNSNATALYELGKYEQALESAQKANIAVQTMTEKDWLIAYPGNDPKIGSEGLSAFKKAVFDNMHTIMSATSSSAVQ